LSFICRYSNKFLNELLKLTEQKIYGHCESFPHTVCVHKNFEVYDLLKDGFFNIEYCRHDSRFDYNNLTNIPKDKLVHACKF